MGRMIWDHSENRGKSKWEILEERAHSLETMAKVIRRDMEWMEETALEVECSGCGTAIHTEADFAKHFVVTNNNGHLNLGECPFTEKGKRLQK